MAISSSLVVASLRHGSDHSIIHYVIARAGQVSLSQLPNYTIVTLVCYKYIVANHFGYLFLLIL